MSAMPATTTITTSLTPLPRRPRNHKPNWMITSEEVEQGSILWLGTAAETSDAQRLRGLPQQPVGNVKTGLPANDGMYEHPILIVSRPQSDPSKIYFLPMTSFSGKPLDQRYHGRKASYHKATFVPLAPAPEHPHFQNGDARYRRLSFEHNDQLERPSYANIRELYVMDWRAAQLYWGSNPNLRKQWKLDAASIHSVTWLAAEHAGLTLEEQYTPPRPVAPPSIGDSRPVGAEDGVAVPVLTSRSVAGLGIDIPTSPRSTISAGLQWPTVVRPATTPPSQVPSPSPLVVSHPVLTTSSSSLPTSSTSFPSEQAAQHAEPNHAPSPPPLPPHQAYSHAGRPRYPSWHAEGVQGYFMERTPLLSMANSAANSPTHSASALSTPKDQQLPPPPQLFCGLSGYDMFRVFFCQWN